MPLKKQEISADDFWREFESKSGEKVLAKTMGQYLSGWEEFKGSQGTPMWGIVIATTGGFRFHHFPRHNWLDALLGSGALQADREQTLFIPRGRIISASIKKETKWWKKLLSPSPAILIIQYRREDGTENKLLIQTEFKTEGLVENLL